jgi:formylglycine-generating enzyme required for sulfatase activity
MDVLPWGLVPGGSPLDITARGVKNLCGSVNEYVADAFNRYSEPCWTMKPILIDPRCDTPGADMQYVTLRGAAWNQPPVFAKMYDRNTLGGPGPASKTGGDSSLGFRCARSM